MANLDEMLNGLSDEEKKALKQKLLDLYKAEDEREIDKIEEAEADDTEVKDEKSEEVKAESKEIGEDVDDIEEKVEETLDEKKAEETEENNQDKKAEIEEVVEEPKTEEVVAEDKPSEIAELKSEIASLKEMVGSLVKGNSNVEAKADEVYGIGNGVFQGTEQNSESKKLAPSDIKEILNKIKR